MKAPTVQKKTLKSFDGTSIGYQVCGEGPAVVLANGLGGTYSTWRHQYALLGEKYRILSWDYRGLFSSGRPSRLDSFGLDAHIRDLDLLLDAEGIEKTLLVGWSMGVQVNFEYYRKNPGRVAAIVILNGVPGHPFSTAFGGRAFRNIIPLGIGLMKSLAPALGGPTKIVTQWSGLAPTLQAIGMAAKSLDLDVFNDLVHEFASLDFEAYAETLRELGEHDATDLLHRIEVPTLIITGSRDFFTPLPTARAMEQAIPGAKLVVIEGATHYAAVEFPREVNEAIRSFLRRIGYGPIV
jgi:pimeloyl-ACP methyl ester carboxylesterase